MIQFPEVKTLRQIMVDFHAPYWIAGGWAIDMHLGRQTRPHKDIEIAIDRKDQKALFKSKNPRDIDNQDFDNALPVLINTQRKWLSRSIASADPDHPWLTKMNA